MKTKLELLKEYEDIFKTKYEEVNSIKHSDNSGYKFFGNSWASVVSIDIIGFKKMVASVDNETMVKVVQLFTDTVATLSRESYFKEVFRDIYYAGDQVLVVFDANQKEKISKVIEFSFYLNSQINQVLSSYIEKNVAGINSFKAGIGIWTSQDNTLVYSGLKGSKNHSNSTLIGSAINMSSELSSIASRNNKPEILMNSTTYINALGAQKESLEKWMKQISLGITREKIYGGSIVKTVYL